MRMVKDCSAAHNARRELRSVCSAFSGDEPSPSGCPSSLRAAPAPAASPRGRNTCGGSGSQGLCVGSTPKSQTAPSPFRGRVSRRFERNECCLCHSFLSRGCFLIGFRQPNNEAEAAWGYLFLFIIWQVLRSPKSPLSSAAHPASGPGKVGHSGPWKLSHLLPRERVPEHENGQGEELFDCWDP